MFQSVSIFSLYNPLFQCLETPEMGPGIFTFSRSCFNFVSKRFETTETFGHSQFLSCFSPFQLFPYIIHCFSVSKHQKWGLVFSLFLDLVSILFRNVSKQLKHLDLVNFLPVSVRFSFFPIKSTVSVFRNTRNGAWYFHFFQSLFQFCFETVLNNWNIWT